MSPALRAVFFVAVLLLHGLALGQTKPSEPTKITLCEMVKDPGPFDGKMVQFRAEYFSGFQKTSLMDEHCKAEVEIGLGHVLDTLKPGIGQYAYTEIADEQSDEFKHFERLSWKTVQTPRPVRLVNDGNYREFRRYVDAKFRWKDGGLCRNCPLYRITVTATGRFDYFRKEWVAVRTDAAATPYISSGNPLMRFTLQSVSAAVASPIDPSVYSESKRRNVSMEEANDLALRASGCVDGRCVLVPFEDDSKYYGFQGVWVHPPGDSVNRGYFLVDPLTGDVWNGVICEQFKSVSLVKLQRTIRQRIGLTDEEYQMARKPGPLCEPGMPRISTPK